MFYFVLIGLLLNPAAQTDLGWQTRITNADEDGEPLTISGFVYAADGSTPVVGARVYVYHTDNEGYYSPGGRDEDKRRLNGTMITDSQGRFRFTTIKPAPYPTGGIPAHIHMQLRVGNGSMRHFELQFEGDPNLSASQVKTAKALGDFSPIQALRREGQMLHGTWTLKL